MQSAFFPSPTAAPAQQQAASGAELPGSSLSSKHRASATHTSSTGRHAAPGSIGQSSTAGSSRALRFPSSRRYLWDRTAAGPQALIDVLDYLPHVHVAASTFGAISRASSSKAGSLTLQQSLSVTSTNQVTVLIQERDPLNAQGALQLQCALLQPGAADSDAVSSLRATMQAQVDQRDIARVQQLYALSASAAASASPAEPTSLRLQLLLPRVGLLANPLYTKRLCHVPLAEALLKPGCMAAGQTGYLSMDQARSLLPLEATDANVYSTPLVGVWVKGPSSVLHPLVAAACLRFAYSSLLMDRAVNPDDGAFLLLLCPEGDPVSKCFEVSMTDSGKLELCCYRAEAGVRPAGGLSQYPGGLVSATWVPEQRTVQPLPSTLLAAAGKGGAPGAAAASTPSRPTSGYYLLSGRGVHEPPAAHSPVVHGHTGRAGELPLGRSSAPSSTFGGYHAAEGQLQQQDAAAAAAASARRSLPMAYYGEGDAVASSQEVFGVSGGAAAGRAWVQHGPTGLSPWGIEEPQPRAGVPAGSYMPAPHVQDSRQPWLQSQQEQRAGWGFSAHPAYVTTDPRFNGRGDAGYDGPGEEAAAAAAAYGADQSCGVGAGDVAPLSSCSPTRGSRQQQLSWSDRQDQVLRSSLEGAAEALRNSQASLAAAREAASGAGSRLSSPTKARSTAGDGSAPPPAAGTEAAAAAAAAGGCGSPQPGLSRLGQQQQQAAEGDAESDCGPRMGSPVRASVQRKTSMLAAAAAHAAGVGSAGLEPERPVSPAVQAGLALSNLSLLQHLSSGQLQQDGQGLEAVGHAAVAAAAGSPVAGAGRAFAAGAVLDAQGQMPGQPLHQADAAGVGGPYASTAAPGSSDAAVAESFDASHAAAAAIRAAASSMQKVPVHPYSSQSLGVQRYAADTTVMRSSQGSPGGMMGLLSPGSSPGLYSASNARWQPLQRQQQQQQEARLPAAWSPGAAGMPSPGVLQSGSTGGGSALWQQQEHFSGVPQQQQQQQLQASPVSAAVSPGWVPDPVAQALQGEVERLRQQLQQLQQQLKLAGMALPASDLDTASGAATPVAKGAPVAADTPASGTAAAAAAATTPSAVAKAAAGPGAGAAAGSPIHVHNVYPVHVNVWMPGKQQHQQPQVDVTPLAAADAVAAAVAAAEQGWELQAQQLLLPPTPAELQQQQHMGLSEQRYPTVSYAGNVPAAIQSQGAHGDSTPPGAAAVAPPAGQGSVSAEGPAAAAAAASAADVDAAADTAAGPSGAAPPQHSLDMQQDRCAADAAASVANTGSASQPQSAAQVQPVDAAAADEDVAAAQQAAASARQRRRKLDFHAAAAEAAAADPGRAGDSAGSEGSNGGATGSQAADVSCEAQVPADAADAASAGQRAAVEEGSGAGITFPVPCSSPAVKRSSDAAAAAAAKPRPAVAAAEAPGPAHAGWVARSSAASSGAGLCYSVPRSSGGGLGHLLASLGAPPLVEVVRARVVDLSDDSDSDEWEDRLLVKYGLK